MWLNFGSVGRGSFSFLSVNISLATTSLSGEHDREPQHTTTIIIDLTTESTSMRIIQHTIYTIPFPLRGKYMLVNTITTVTILQDDS